jgi:streptomycin 6-kinase
MTDWPQLPDGIVEGIEKRWPERARPWADQVEAELREFCQTFNATPRDVLAARYGFVVAADSPRGGLVFRSSPDPDALVQADVASALAGIGVSPAVHDIVATPSGIWTVMDEVLPGTPLALTNKSAVDLHALAAPFAAMYGQPAPRAEMLSIFEWLQIRLEDDNLSDIPVWRDGPAPIEERHDALDLLENLAQDSQLSLCHGDASSWNLLSSGSAHWQLVDPRGVSGEVAYDLAVVAMKLRGDMSTDEVAGHLARAAKVSIDRVLAWISIAEAARV